MNFSRVERNNILIVDDVTSNLIALTEIIRGAGYTPRPVTSVTLARKAIEAEQPDLILLDITMPEMNGYDYCKMLKKDARTKEIPVIFISGLTSSQDKERGFECGAVDYISKPFEKSEVVLRVNTHLKLYKMQREMADINSKLHTLVSQQLHQLESERKNMILSFARMSENRTDPSGEHLRNIAANSRKLSIGLSFSHKYEKVISNDFITAIEVACVLHDIGKITIEDRILNKPERLTPRESGIVKEHCSDGVDMLNDIYNKNSKNSFLKVSIDIAGSHHEKWDGTGFPKGLKGMEIPLAARIVAVVDTYDNLVSKRCYKEAYSKKEALKYITKEAGKSFDPDIVDVFVRLEKQLIGGCEDAIPGRVAASVASDPRR